MSPELTSFAKLPLRTTKLCSNPEPFLGEKPMYPFSKPHWSKTARQLDSGLSPLRLQKSPIEKAFAPLTQSCMPIGQSPQAASDISINHEKFCITRLQLLKP
ncbi:hypothetical protein [Stenotrophomonas sp. RG-453]|uniref:hypothetical protein n=1 Tax=Stenotrophomonas sp. RG-453 TaxID=2957502 RepID=UPI0029CA79EC|nr:hypothetical protein [Stenotrophomonas sp. RG-453]